MIRLRIALVFLITMTVIVGYCLDGLAQKDLKMKSKYTKFSSASNYIKLLLKDEKEHEVFNIIVDNADFAGYMAEKDGLKVLGRMEANDQQQFKEFIEEKYVSYMLKNEGKMVSIDFKDFIKFIAKKKFGDERQVSEFLKSFIYEKPSRLEDLNVRTEEELIKKYFDFNKETLSGNIKNEHIKNYNDNPAFIALLLEFGYEVYRGDVVPTLFIRKE